VLLHSKGTGWPWRAEFGQINSSWCTWLGTQKDSSGHTKWGTYTPLGTYIYGGRKICVFDTRIIKRHIMKIKLLKDYIKSEFKKNIYRVNKKMNSRKYRAKNKTAEIYMVEDNYWEIYS
jgi:hypothetical protein